MTDENPETQFTPPGAAHAADDSCPAACSRGPRFWRTRRMDGGLSCRGDAPRRGLGFLFLRDLGALLARLGKSDSDRLLAALDLLARASAAKRARFLLLHRALDLLGGALGIFPLLRFLRHLACSCVC